MRREHRITLHESLASKVKQKERRVCLRVDTTNDDVIGEGDGFVRTRTSTVPTSTYCTASTGRKTRQSLQKKPLQSVLLQVKYL